MNLDGSVLDYLRAMEDLGERGVPLRNGALAEALKVKPPSVSQMLDRLREMGLVEGEVRAGVELTREGLRLARRSVRRHRLIETWLVRSLGLPWDMAHEEAHALEHALSARLEEELDRRLGRPERDPHGAAIPDQNGKARGGDLRPLASLAEGEAGVLVRLDDRDPKRLEYWRSLGASLGAPVLRERGDPFGEVIHLRIGDKHHQVGRRALEGLWVAAGGEKRG